MRYFFELSYRGKAYHGWQRQPNALSVQEVVEQALATLLQREVEITGAGRTDTGVHARQIFAHADLEADVDSHFLFRLNRLLPLDVAAHAIRRVHENAHARFDADSRTYEYHITQTNDVFAIETANHLERNLNLAAMNQAAGILMEYDSFKSFSRSRTDVRTFDCRIQEAHWEKMGSRLVFKITADRFLRNMVRAVVGTLLEIGLGRTKPEEIREIITSEDRSRAGASVPAHGLFLTNVEYPKSIFY